MCAQALVLGLVAHAAVAQQAERPAVKAGDQWRFAVYYTVPSNTPSRTWIVTSVSQDRIEATENGEPLLMTLELNVLDSPRSSESNPRSLRFPLRVGESWRYTSDWLFKAKGSKGGVDVEVAVVAQEKVKVPAGEFEAFRIVSRGTLSGTSPINSQFSAEVATTYWYAPAVRAIVKSVVQHPYLGPSTVDLVDFKLAP